MRSQVLPLLLVFMVAAGAQNTRYQAKDTGEITIRYGTPMWRDDLLERAGPGTWWRLGSGSATTFETSAAVVAKEGVVFPGTYNLNLGTGPDWELLFHNDGTFYRNGPKVAVFGLTKGEIEEKGQAAPRLQIDLEPEKDKALRSSGGARFRVRFGPHTVEGSWQILGVAKKRSTSGSVGFTLETVKLPASETFQSVLDGKAETPFSLARLTLEQTKVATILSFLPGDEPLLRFEGLDREVKGTRTAVSSHQNPLKATVEKESLKLHLGSTQIVFPLEASLLKKAQTGASTSR